MIKPTDPSDRLAFLIVCVVVDKTPYGV